MTKAPPAQCKPKPSDIRSWTQCKYSDGLENCKYLFVYIGTRVIIILLK